MLQEVFPRQWRTVQRWPVLQYHMSGMSLAFLRHKWLIYPLNFRFFILSVFLSSFIHEVTVAATPWTTVISQRPALGTLDRCSCAAFVFGVWVSHWSCWEWWAWLKRSLVFSDCFQCPPNLHKQDGYVCQVTQVCGLIGPLMICRASE